MRATQAHALSHRRSYRGGMLALDLLVALTPAVVLACLWLKDLLARRPREGRERMARLWHEAPRGRRIGRPV